MAVDVYKRQLQTQLPWQCVPTARFLFMNLFLNRNVFTCRQKKEPLSLIHIFAAYPELSCDSTQTYKVSPTWGEFEQVFCPSETTFKFFEGVMDEVIELFPSEYIHIGGDE